MDSVTQAALGAAVAGMVAGRRCSPKVLLAGALLGTLPDLDVVIDYGDPVANTVNHRGFSHSLFVLPPLGVAIAALWWRLSDKTWPLWQLMVLVVSVLVTHPLLDSMTAYGTQLFWPLDKPPVAVASIFIIDPLYTLPLLIGVLAALVWRANAARLCVIGLIASSLYLLSSVYQLEQIKARVAQQTQGTELAGKPMFITPTPFNTVLWRIVVRGEQTYWEGLASRLDKTPEIDWMAFEQQGWPLAESESLTALRFFARDFLRYENRGGQQVVTDLRLGMANYRPFQFLLAEQSEQGEWRPVPPRQLEPGPVLPRTIPALWRRLLGDQSIDALLCNQKDCYPNEEQQAKVRSAS
ncbi:metal-dependent hydrolase [Salinivibrio costicola]|uniref:Metal-dependent hydrolase n=1 Tax=Salinivibrio costicola TaxID=51367 RepID=A0ABX6K6E7_SALCS|nr:metal-dependent hydrolase [Salinivibrio costicola]QIR05821.1 metal-dependent hydrolase [Salinivibrio costicola]